MGEPGAQGASTIGRHGIGVSTPIAAAVAAATCGFACVLHIPKGAMLTKGTRSATDATTIPPVSGVAPACNTVSELGDSPSLHESFAPFAVSFAISPAASSRQQTDEPAQGQRPATPETGDGSSPHSPTELLVFFFANLKTGLCPAEPVAEGLGTGRA
jgi:hypothetical protein